MTKLEEKVENLVKPIIEDLGYSLFDVVHVKEAKDYYLRIFIDSENGISLEDCEKVSNAINDILDEKDYIKEQYFLEVSSAGLERVLRRDEHLEANIGSEIEVKLFKNFENKKVYQGVLKSFDNELVVLETENNEVNLERKNIAIMKTIYKW